MKGLFLAIVALALLALLGCSSSAKPTAPLAATPAATVAQVATVAATASPSAAPTPEPTPEAYALALTVTAHNKSDDPCGGGYRLEGASVTVRDEHGTVIGAGATGANVRPLPQYPYGVPDFDPQRLGAHLHEYSAYIEAEATCQVQATVSVPRAAFYQLTIGTHGGPTHSFDELQAAGWKLDLSLQ